MLGTKTGLSLGLKARYQIRYFAQPPRVSPSPVAAQAHRT